jgi:hypothetical protein
MMLAPDVCKDIGRLYVESRLRADCKHNLTIG